MKFKELVLINISHNKSLLKDVSKKKNNTMKTILKIKKREE